MSSNCSTLFRYRPCPVMRDIRIRLNYCLKKNLRIGSCSFVHSYTRSFITIIALLYFFQTKTNPDSEITHGQPFCHVSTCLFLCSTFPGYNTFVSVSNYSNHVNYKHSFMVRNSYLTSCS